MAGVRGPLLSMHAKGSVGKTLTFTTWRGLPVTKTHSKPTNPKSLAQQAARATWAYLNELYRQLPNAAKASWSTPATAGTRTAINKWLNANQSSLYNAGNLAPLSETKAGQNAPAEPPPTISTGTGTITSQSAGPTPPENWTLAYQFVDAIPDTDPTTFTPPIAPVATSGPQNPPLNWTLAGLISGQLYQVYTYSALTNSKGATIYTAAHHDSATPN